MHASVRLTGLIFVLATCVTQVTSHFPGIRNIHKTIGSRQRMQKILDKFLLPNCVCPEGYTCEIHRAMRQCVPDNAQPEPPGSSQWKGFLPNLMNIIQKGRKKVDEISYVVRIATRCMVNNVLCDTPSPCSAVMEEACLKSAGPAPTSVTSQVSPRPLYTFNHDTAQCDTVTVSAACLDSGVGVLHNLFTSHTDCWNACYKTK